MIRGKYFKIYIIEIILVMLFFILAYPFLKVKELNMTSLRESIRQSLDEDLNEGTLEDIRKIYGISKNDINEFLFFKTKNNMNPKEVLVIEFKNETSLNNNKKNIENVLENKKNSFKDYNADAYSLLDKSIFKVKGCNLILIVEEDNKKIEKIINENFR
ncbi:DUF4358 domain-containing protein [uncultured Clostridium sp.]|uniref:DUF4358 domain-containing protein n=1 Tax=uncultured Clostridium sp. TaxID=59620 RepID=UPI002584AB97|nr:DUF4358 domain-containing protein [uncultured Clostridium sp.]